MAAFILGIIEYRCALWWVNMNLLQEQVREKEKMAQIYERPFPAVAFEEMIEDWERPTALNDELWLQKCFFFLKSVVHLQEGL